MIEDLSDYKKVGESECITTGLIDSNVLMDNTLVSTYFIDINGKEWVIKEMNDEDPILIARE